MLILKAKRPKWVATRTRQRLTALSQNMGKAVGMDLVSGLKRFKKRVQPEKVYQAWVKQDTSEVMRSIPWQNLDEDLDPAFKKGKTAFENAWDIIVPSNLDKHLRFDTGNPRIREFIKGRKAFNFTNLTKDSADNIQHWVTRSFDRALSPRQVADGIKNQIGLLPAHAGAVASYRVGLIQGGLLSMPRVEALTNEYADRLLDYRAMMIGRTETRLATNQGQNMVWRQAADSGLIDRHSTGRAWIVDGDPCEICLPMDGKVVGLDQPWTLEDGTTVDCPPEDVHPHCECTFEMVFDVDPSEIEAGE